MAALQPDTALGDLVISSTTMYCAAWIIVDPSRLWTMGDLRGSDRPLPGGGTIAYPRRPNATKITLPMHISRTHDRLGAAYAVDGYEGLESNINYLRTNVTDPPNLGTFPDGSRPATLTMPSGSTRTAHLNDFKLTIGQALPSMVFATLEFSIVEGVFV